MNSNQSIAWINGSWDSSERLSIPVSDRGVKFGDGIFETILISKGQPKLLHLHLNRWYKSASLLNMANPPEGPWLDNLINEAIRRSNIIENFGALRLNWSRGNSLDRGINIDNELRTSQNHRFWLEISPIEINFNQVSTKISKRETRNPKSQLSKFKTLNYMQAIQAREEGIMEGFDDALLTSINGEISCGTTANLVIKRKNKLLTPRLESGCLPGIMRAQGLRSGLLKEAKISKNPEAGDQWLLINSLGCKPISKVDSFKLNIFEEPQKFWESLLSH